MKLNVICMKLFSTKTLIFAIIVLCSSCAQYEYSQFRSEEENQKRFAELFYKSIKSCDGRERSAHESCVSAVKEELILRFDDRNKAFMTKAQVVAMVTTQLIIQYKIEKAQKAVAESRQSSANTSVASSQARSELAFKGNENLAISDTIRTTSSRVCRAAPFSFSFSISNYVPIICN